MKYAPKLGQSWQKMSKNWKKSEKIGIMWSLSQKY